MKANGRVKSRADNQPTQAILQHVVCRVVWNALRESAEEARC